MASSPSPVGRVRPLETPDPRRADYDREDVVVRSTGPGESSSVLYQPQELAFMAYINDPSHKNSSRLSYAQYRDYKYWCEHPEEPSHGPHAANMKNRAKDFEVRDGMLYRKPHTVSQGTKSERSFGYRRVIQADYAWSTIRKAHIRSNHRGRDKTWDEVQELYYGITKEEVGWYIENCSHCVQARRHQSRPPMISIKSWNTFERVQADLIDMRSQPDGQYKWILHLKDHFSKFTFLWPLESKMAQNVCDGIAVFIMVLGPMRILQMDNGAEFKGVLLYLLRRHGIRVINGNPRHPQSQGLVEQGNGTVKSRLAAWMEENDTGHWATGLIEAALGINNDRSAATGLRPYDIVFGRPCNINDDNWLDHTDRQEATICNEDGEPEDDEASIAFQARLERTDPFNTSASELHGELLPTSDDLPLFTTPTIPTPARVQLQLATGIGSSIIDLPALADQPGVLKLQKKAQQQKQKTTQNTHITETSAQASAQAKGKQRAVADPQSLMSTALQAQIIADEQLARQLQDSYEKVHRSLPSTTGGDSMDVDEDFSHQSRYSSPGDTIQISDRSSSLSPPQSHQSSSGGGGNGGAEETDDVASRVNQLTMLTRARQEEARQKQEARFGARFGNKIETFAPGQIIALVIPKQDRSSLDQRRMFARVLKRSGHRYQLQTEYGILNRMYTARCVSSVSDFLNKSTAIPDNKSKLTLREAARRASKATADRVRCSCKTMPCSKRCGCIKAGKGCTIYCHGEDSSCGNEAEGSAFNEMALLERSNA